MDDDLHVSAKEANIDRLNLALIHTRNIRLALDTIWGEMPEQMNTEDVNEIIDKLYDQLRKSELYALRTYGLIYEYVIIRPLDMTNLPDAETLQKISSAVQTLADLGLIVESDEA